MVGVGIGMVGMGMGMVGMGMGMVGMSMGMVGMGMGMVGMDIGMIGMGVLVGIGPTQRQLCRSCVFIVQGCGRSSLPWVAAQLL